MQVGHDLPGSLAGDAELPADLGGGDVVRTGAQAQHPAIGKATVGEPRRGHLLVQPSLVANPGLAQRGAQRATPAAGFAHHRSRFRMTTMVYILASTTRGRGVARCLSVAMALVTALAVTACDSSGTTSSPAPKATSDVYRWGVVGNQ